MKTLPAFLLLAFSTSVIAQEPSGADTRKCTVEGRVLKEGSQEPIRKARLVLSSGMSSMMQAMTRAESGETKPKSMRELSGTDGKFKFENVEPGTYTLGASRTGFVPARYSDPKGAVPASFSRSIRETISPISLFQ